MSSIDPVTGNQRIEPQEPGPKPKTSSKVKGPKDRTDGESQSEQFLPARSVEGGQNSPNPIINPDDPYNRMSGAGSGEQGQTIIGAGTTREESTPKKAAKAVTRPPTDETGTGDLVPAGDTKTTTAEDLIDASDAVAAGQSHPVETEYFGELQERHRHQAYVTRTSRARSKVEVNTATGSRPNVGETVTLRAGGIKRDDDVWVRVKGPDQDTRTRAAIEGDQASAAVLITRPGQYVLGLEINTKVVDEVEFSV